MGIVRTTLHDIYYLPLLFFLHLQGASAGMIVSYCITAWLAIGSVFVDKGPTHYLPTSVDGCTNHTFSNHIAPGYLINAIHSRSPNTAHNESIDALYREDYTDAATGSDGPALQVVPAKTEFVKLTLIS